MDRLRILIADDDAEIAEGLWRMVQDLGHEVISCSTDGIDAVRQARQHEPDLILMDLGLRGVGGLEASQAILAHRPLPIVILAALGDPRVVERAEAIGVSGYLLKPVRRSDVQPAIVLALARFQRIRALQQEILGPREALLTRRLIDQAKGLLMEREGLSEPEADRRVQQLSHSRNVPLARMAEAIVLTDQLMEKMRTSSERSTGQQRSAA